MDAAVIISGREVIFEILPKNIADVRARQRVLQALSLHAPVVILSYGKQQQDAVTLLRVADLPGVKELVRIILDIHAVQKIRRHDDNLRAAGVFEHTVLLYDIVLCLLFQHIREICRVERIRRGWDRREGAAAGSQCRQNYRQQRCSHFSFHSHPSFLSKCFPLFFGAQKRRQRETGAA